MTTGPVVYTETGYSTVNGTTSAQSAAYTLDLIMDCAYNGITRTYLYELMEEGDGFGLFDTNNNPTATATAIHNFTTILADAGTTRSSFTSEVINYTITNLPATGFSMPFQKSNGANVVIVWNEPSTFPGPVVNVKVSFPFISPMISVYDPLVSTSATNTVDNASSVTISLTSHPIIIIT
jgi:hypothetical protein